MIAYDVGPSKKALEQTRSHPNSGLISKLATSILVAGTEIVWIGFGENLVWIRNFDVIVHNDSTIAAPICDFVLVDFHVMELLISIYGLHMEG